MYRLPNTKCENSQDLIQNNKDNERITGRYIKNLRWYIAVLLLFATTINYLDRSVFAVVAPTLKEKFHIDPAQYSFIISAFIFAYGFSMPIAGRLIDWLGSRVGFALAVIWWTTANICTIFATGVKSFAFFRFLLGIGESGNFPAAVKTVSEWFPAKERAMAVGIFNLGAGFGAIIAPPLIVMAIMHWGWQSAFLVTAIFDFVWVIVWLIFYRSPEKHKFLSPKEMEYIKSGQVVETNGNSKGVWKEIIGKRELWACIGANFLTGPIWLFYVFWVPMYLVDARGFNLKEVAMFAWLPPLTGDIGSIVGGTVSTLFIKFGISVLRARKMAMFIFALMMPAALFAVFTKNPYYAIAFICIATFGHQSWAANLVTLPADLFSKRQVASAYGMTGWGGGLGGIIFLPCIGFLIKYIGYAPVFTIAGFMHIIAIFIIILLIKKPLISQEVLS